MSRFTLPAIYFAEADAQVGLALVPEELDDARAIPGESALPSHLWPLIYGRQAQCSGVLENDPTIGEEDWRSPRSMLMLAEAVIE